MDMIKPQKYFSRNKLKTAVPTTHRIDELIHTLGDWLKLYPDAQFAIEITSGKTSSRHGGSGAGLGTYGMAVGHVARWAICNTSHDRVHQVYENDWTRGSKKERRKAHAEYAYPLYKENWSEKDKGGDISDAIMLGDYTMNLINTGLIGGAA